MNYFILKNNCNWKLKSIFENNKYEYDYKYKSRDVSAVKCNLYMTDCYKYFAVLNPKIYKGRQLYNYPIFLNVTMMLGPHLLLFVIIVVS